MIIACIKNTIETQTYDLVLFPGIYKATPPYFHYLSGRNAGVHGSLLRF